LLSVDRTGPPASSAAADLRVNPRFPPGETLNLLRPGHNPPGLVVDPDEIAGERENPMSTPYQPHEPYQPYTDATPAATPAASSRIAAILAHLSAPIAALLSAGSLSLLGPLLVWLVKKNDPYARRAAAGAFNFNLTFWLLYLLSWLLILTVVGAVIGIPMIIVLFLVSAWCHIKGAVRAADDRPYDYPFQIRVLS
jgi:uncharacterized Tic20 family protein